MGISESITLLFIVYVLCIAAHCVLTIALLWNVMQEERGADRLCWMMMVPVPLFGPLAFFILLPQERKKRLAAEDYEKSLKWAKTVGDKI